MSTLDEYLSGIYEKDRRQLRALGRLVNSALPVFTRFWDEDRKTWPYKVSGRTGPSNIDKKLSLSTHSMILFTLEAICSVSRNSVLMPPVSHPLKIKERDEENQNKPS